MGKGQAKSRSYIIELTANAEKQFLKLPKKNQLQVAALIDSLADNPRPSGVKKFHAGIDLYRVRKASFRVIYQIRDAILMVLVVRIADRKEAYQNLERLFKQD
jgi:mRNA interferase RelE/StbE